MNLKLIKEELKKYENPERAEFSRKYFHPKAHPNVQEEFLGVSVPEVRKLAKKYWLISREELSSLIQSKVHEERQLGLFILVIQYQKAKKEEKGSFVELYLKNLDFVNNWDLVDDSSPKILGNWLLDKDKKILFELAKSGNYWKRRIAIVATLAFIRKNHFETTIQLADILLNDNEKLIHKAVGWMIREVYKRNPGLAKKWIEKNLVAMPREMLRYAIEKVPEKERLKLLYANG